MKSAPERIASARRSTPLDENKCLLERGEGVEHVGRRFDRHLCVMDERPPRLLLQRPEAGVVLVAPLPYCGGSDPVP